MQLKKIAANSKPHYQGACQWCCCFIQEHRGKWRRKLAEKVWFALPFLHLTLFSWLLFLEHAGELRINILRRIFFLASYVLYFLYIGTLSTAVLLANHGFQKKPLRCSKTNMLRLDRCTLGIFTQLTGFRGFYSSLFQMSLALLIQIHNFLEIDLYMCLSCTFCRKWDSKLTRQGGPQRYPLLCGSLKPSYVWANLLQRWDCKC